MACFPVHAFQCMPVSPRPRPRCWTRVLRSALTHQGHRQLAPALRRLIPFSSASVPAAVRPSPWTRRLRIFNDDHQTKSNRTCAKTSILTETVIPLPQEAIPPAIAPIIIRVGWQRSNQAPSQELRWLSTEKVGDKWLICEPKYGAVRCS